MDPRLLTHYNEELAYIREMGAEFAREFPKIAARLGIEGLEVADPYVERLLEGFAFIAARIQVKLDAEFPRFTQHLLEMVYPNFLSPIPSFGICELVPNYAETALLAGVKVPRGTSLRSAIARGEQTACEFRSAHDITLWPLTIEDVRYFAFAPDVRINGIASRKAPKGGIRIKLETQTGIVFNQIDCDALDFHINASDAVAIQLYELILGHTVQAQVRWPTASGFEDGIIAASGVSELGFNDQEALLPQSHRSFQGYRLLQEYFAFAQRFLFFRVCGLNTHFRRITGNSCELVLLFDQGLDSLESQVDRQSLTLFTTPVVNLFPKRADRVHVSEERFEHHLVVDRARPMDFEVYAITDVKGLSLDEGANLPFHPFYAGFQQAGAMDSRSYYTLRREQRIMSARQRQSGPRANYAGSEVFLSLVDERQAPYPLSLQQLAVEVLATNRDLPLLLPIGSLASFSLQDSLPVSSVRMLKGPTRPRAASPPGDHSWRLINHLSLNYLSIFEADRDSGAGALRELLDLYCDAGDPAARKQIDALRSVTARPVVSRMPIPGPIVFGRGLEITLELEEAGFAGAGGYLLGSVLEKFFGRYVSLNSFTRTRLRAGGRGEVAAWRPRAGSRIIG